MNMTLLVNVSMQESYNPYTLQFVRSRTCAPGLLRITIFVSTAVEVTLSSLTLASRTATTLSVTWSAGYPKCYSFTVSHSTQDGSINVTQPADNDTSHTLTSLQPGTTYRIEVEAVRKGDGTDGQRATVIGSFSTNDAGVGNAAHVCTYVYRMYVYVYHIYEGIRDCHMHARYINTFYYYTHTYVL